MFVLEFNSSCCEAGRNCSLFPEQPTLDGTNCQISVGEGCSYRTQNQILGWKRRKGTTSIHRLWYHWANKRSDVLLLLMELYQSNKYCGCFSRSRVYFPSLMGISTPVYISLHPYIYTPIYIYMGPIPQITPLNYTCTTHHSIP